MLKSLTGGIDLKMDNKAIFEDRCCKIAIFSISIEFCIQ